MNTKEFIDNYYKKDIEFGHQYEDGFRYTKYTNRNRRLIRNRTEDVYTMLLSNFPFRMYGTKIPPYSLLNLIS